MNFLAPLLKSGDTIGVLAPSSYWDKEKFAEAAKILTGKGFNLIFHDQCNQKDGQFAGTVDQKISALHEFFQNPNINAIFTLVGGNGVLHLLDEIDYSLIKQNPKLLIGFSDITALLHAITTQTGMITYHGPTVSRLDKIKPEHVDQMLNLLTNDTLNIPVNSDIEAKGTLYGGNLSMMQSLIGTNYIPPADEDKILFFEDTNDHLSRYDRMIAHMKLAGWFNNTKAILIGDFIKSQDNPNRPFGFSIEEIVKNHVGDIPVITGLPVGHHENLVTLPIGAAVSLKNGLLSYKSSS
ncbi:MAG: LD-carboxypeptidase [Pseudomonadota bacterium]